MLKKLVSRAFPIILLFAPLLACAAPEEEPYVAGQHYVVLDKPVRTRDAGKIEVVEVFWYGCSHCFKFEPMVEKWHASQADDVDFWHSPAMWRENMVAHAQAFYTAKALKVLDKLHGPLFHALNVERKALDDEEELAEFFAAYGVEPKKFLATYNSFAVKGQVDQANRRARAYKITSTPEMIVNGKYRVSGRTAGSQANMLKIVDFLVEKERNAS
jgi:thiol:disulfide interchange protein DsbA